MYKILTVLYLDFQGASEGHAEVSVMVFVKYSLEGLLKKGSIEGVAHHNMAPVNTNCTHYLQQIQTINPSVWVSFVLEYTKHICTNETDSNKHECPQQFISESVDIPSEVR